MLCQLIILWIIYSNYITNRSFLSVVFQNGCQKQSCSSCLWLHSFLYSHIFWGKGIIVCGILLFLFLIQFLQEVYGEHTKISGRYLALIGTYFLFYIYRYILHASSIKGVILSILTNLYPVFVLMLCTDKEKRIFWIFLHHSFLLFCFFPL